MRKILISILLAGAAVATPAMADPQDGNGRWHHDQQQQERSQAHEERSQAHEERSQAREQIDNVRNRVGNMRSNVSSGNDFRDPSVRTGTGI